MTRLRMFGPGLSLLAAGSALAQHTFVDLGTLTDRSSAAFSLNDDGVVVGESTISGSLGNLKTGEPAIPFIPHAFRWDSGVMTDLGAFPSQGGCSPYGCTSRAEDISNAGVIAGWSADPYVVPFVWLAEDSVLGKAGLNALPSLFSNNSHSRARAINEMNQIVGESTVIAQRAVLWQHNGLEWIITDLGTLMPNDAFNATAMDINESGQIVGGSNVSMNQFSAFLHLPESDYGLPPGMNNLDPGGAFRTVALAVNDLGQTVGFYDILPVHSWIWLPEPAYGFPAGLSELPLYEGATVYATDINNLGQIVATAYVPQGEAYAFKGVLFDDGQWIAIDDLLPKGAPWNVRNGAHSGAINDDGVITGDALSTTMLDITGLPASHAFLLRPNTPGDLNSDGSVNVVDLLLLISSWGACSPQPESCPADLNADDFVNIADLLILISNWG